MAELTAGATKFLVDDGDVNLVQSYRWGPYHGQYTTYLQAWDSERRAEILLHRLLMGFPSGTVDHINHNGLDNRRQNLRVASRSQNAANQRRRPNTKSGYKGVGLLYDKYYVARIKRDGKVSYLGCFESGEDAARAYDAAAKEIFGEFALLNFPVL